MIITVTVAASDEPGTPGASHSVRLAIDEAMPARDAERIVALTAEGLMRKLEGPRASRTPVSEGGRG